MTGKRELPHTIEIKLQSVYETLKSAGKKAADYMMGNAEQMMSQTIGEAAEKAGCSEATFVRLSKKLGYQGYCQLKQACFQGYQNESQKDALVYDNIGGQDSEGLVVQKVFQAAIQALEDTSKLMNSSQYHHSLSVLRTAGRVVIIGAGDAYIAAYSAYLKFSRIGLNVIAPSDYDVQLLEASKLKKGDVLLMISHSGNTKTLYQAAVIAKAKGAFLITLTNYPFSPIAKLCDETILTAAFMKNPQKETIAKRIPELCVIESMYISILQSKEAQHARCLDMVNIELKKNKII